MKNEYRHTNTTVSLINYHFVFCPRYRRKIFLIQKVEERFKELIDEKFVLLVVLKKEFILVLNYFSPLFGSLLALLFKALLFWLFSPSVTVLLNVIFDLAIFFLGGFSSSI